MYDFIPSKTVRAYAEKTGHIFSDADIAAILFHDQPYERTPALRKLAAQTKDSALRKQIHERLDYEAQLWERFSQNDGRFFYTASMENQERYYASVRAALTAGKAWKSPFGVSKYQLVDRWDKSAAPYICLESPYHGGPVAEYWYDKNGALQMFWSHEITREEWKEMELWNEARFEERFLPLPNPFQRGDIVCWVTSPEKMGVVETSHEDWQDMLTGKRRTPRDFFGASVVVEFLEEDGTFAASHVPLIYLERATLDKTDARKPLLEAAIWLLRGEGC